MEGYNFKQINLPITSHRVDMKVERAERIEGDMRIDHWNLEFLSWDISRILRSRVRD